MSEEPKIQQVYLYAAPVRVTEGELEGQETSIVCLVWARDEAEAGEMAQLAIYNGPLPVIQTGGGYIVPLLTLTLAVLQDRFDVAVFAGEQLDTDPMATFIDGLDMTGLEENG